MFKTRSFIGARMIDSSHLKEDLCRARYTSLRTYRKSGDCVDTAVWSAPGDAGALYVFSAGNAGKVKRLRHSSRSQLAICDVYGRVLGPWIDTQAELIFDDESIAHALRSLRNKYGWQMVLADLGARLTGKMAKRAYIRITFT